MENFNSRTKLILGSKNINKIKNNNIIVFGIGGVGSYVIESLVRIGIEKITIVDPDSIEITNLNRQIHATEITLGQSKVNAMKNRIISINSKAKVICFQKVYLLNNNNFFFNKENNYDYVIDTMDTISAKIDLAEFCYIKKIKLISSMGAGNKLNPTKFQITDLFKTNTDPIAKIMRKELKKRKVKKLKVVFSTEKPFLFDMKNNINSKKQIGSLSYIPGIAGLYIASEVINDLLK